MLVFISIALQFYGNTNPDRAFTDEMSEELIAPVAFTSNLKFEAVVTCPERAFTLLMSLELTEPVLFTSPSRKPTVTDLAVASPLTPSMVMRMRLLSATLASITTTSLPAIVEVTVAIGVVVTTSIALTVPAIEIGVLN